MNINYTEIYRDKLIEIYSNDNFNSFDVGYIVNEDDTYLLISRFTQFGIKDGNLLILKDKINSITCNSEYLDKINFMININKEKLITKDSIAESNSFRLDNNKNILFDVLDKLVNDKIVVTVKLEDTNFLGYVKKYTKDYLIVDYFGSQSLVKIDEIIAIYIDDTTDKRDMMYQEWKKINKNTSGRSI